MLNQLEILSAQDVRGHGIRAIDEPNANEAQKGTSPMTSPEKPSTIADGKSDQNIQPARRISEKPDTSSHAYWSQLLVRLSEDQDKQCFKQLFDHFGPLIKSYYLGKSTHSRLMIDELIQEVMLKMWQKAHTYNPSKAAASTWIFTLARNTYIDMLRRQNKYSTTSSLDSEDIFWEDSTDNGPMDDLQTSRNSYSIKESLSKLPNAQAQIIAKVYMDGKTHAEVAEELDLPLGTVKSRVRLALNKLSDLLKETRI